MEWRCGADGGTVVIAVRTWYCRNLPVSKKRKIHRGSRRDMSRAPNVVESVVVVVLAAVVIVVVEGQCRENDVGIVCC